MGRIFTENGIQRSLAGPRNTKYGSKHILEPGYHGVQNWILSSST